MDKQKLEALNADVKAHGAVDRAHLLSFLTLQNNSDGTAILTNVKAWLQSLHDDPTYDKVIFPNGDIDAVLGDLDSYGRVSADTIYQFKASSTREVTPS